jgi:phenylacetate-CoA ligase
MVFMTALKKKIIKKFTFPVMARRYGLPELYNHTSSLDASQYWSREQIEKLQLQRLKKLLTHACHSSDYYRKLFKEVDFDPEKLTSLEGMKTIPFLTKDIIRNENKALLSTVYSTDQLHSSETGGTTGVKMKFWRNNSCLSPKEAARYRFEQWAGWDFGERMGLVWPAQQDYVGHWSLKAKIKNALFERQLVLPAATLDDSKIENYLQVLKKKQPTVIRAFTSPIYEVAQVALTLKMRFPSIKGIVTTGEPLYKHQRDIIEQAFDCKVFDSYRCREVGPLAQECEQHRGMHINAESLFVEVVEPEQKGVFDEGIGEIVVTDLLNFGMPLIRYKMGDMGILSKRTCECGRGLPILEQISGRSADTLRAPDGKQIAAGSLVLYLVDEAPGSLGQVQVVQDKIDHLLIRMTADPPPTEEIKEYQRKTVKRLFGDKMNVSFEIVEKIERTKSGKYQFARYMV